MDGPIIPGFSGRRDPPDWRAEFDRRLAEVGDAAREAGVDPSGFDGRLVSALIASVAMQAKLAEATEQRWIEATAEERKRLADLCVAADRTLAQMRNGLIGLELQRDMAISRFMEHTAPVFAERLGSVLAIREKRWNLQLRTTWVACAIGLLLAVYGAGATTVWWQARDAVVGLRECIERPYFAGNQAWCLLPQRAGAAVPPVASQSAR